MRELRWVAASAVLLSATVVQAAEVVPNPYAPTGAPAVIDFSRGPVPAREVDSGVRFEDLDDHMREDPTWPEGQADLRPGLPRGWVQQGDVVVPAAVAAGAQVRMPGSVAELADAPRPARGKVEGPSYTDLCMFPDDTPAGIYTGSYNRGSEYPRRGTIYMNYTGGTLINGGENSAENQSTLALNGSVYPVYGGGESKAVAVAQAVQVDFESMAVRVLYLERPPKLLPYVMIMMGGSYMNTTSGPAGGVAPGADCEDAGLRNVCYAFVNGSQVTSQSNTASQEIGHTMGLGHTYGFDRVMAFGYDTNSNIDMGFGNECSEVFVSQGQAGYCAGVNKCHCASDGKQQHDQRTLKTIYAPPGPDMVPPTIEITGPEDGATFASDELITVDVEPNDNFGGYGWELVISQGDEVLGEVVDYQVSQQFLLKGLPPGTYTLTARVQDQSDQVGEDAITVTIEGAGDTDTPTTGDPSGGTDPSGATDPSGGSSGASDSESDTSQEIGEDGCSCRDGERGPWPALLALLGLLALPRRNAKRS